MRINKHYISGLFLCLFLPLSMMLSFISIWICRDKVVLNDVPAFMQGKWASNFEDHYNKSLHTYEPSLNLWTGFTYAAFREGKEGVLVGNNGWLFTREEFEYQKGREHNFNENSKFVKAVHDHLAKNNVELIIVPVPAKARLYSQHLGRFHYPDYNQDIYTKFSDGLTKSGIVVNNTWDAMAGTVDKDLFLRTDTHWTPAGAEVTAQAVAQTIQKHFPEMKLSKADYTTVANGEEEYAGDLTRYVPLGDFVAASEFPPDRIVKVETLASDTSAGGVVDLESDLFSSDVPDITLIGTSYSANEKWNFSGYLQESLHTEVLNAAKEGLGPFEAMKGYLTNEAFKESPPKVIIWEIPERYLTMKYDLETDFYPYKGA